MSAQFIKANTDAAEEVSTASPMKLFFFAVAVMIISIIYFRFGGWSLLPGIYLFIFSIELFRFCKIAATATGVTNAKDKQDLVNVIGWISIGSNAKVLSVLHYLGGIGAWPIYRPLQILLGAAVGFLNPRTARTVRADQVQEILHHYLPLPLQIAISYAALSLIFIGILAASDMSFLLIIAAGVFCAMFSIFAFQFVFKITFRDFYFESVPSPRISYIFTLTLTFISAIFVHGIIQNILSEETILIDRLWLYSTLKLMTVEQKIFDIAAIAENTNDFEEFFYNARILLMDFTLLNIYELMAGGVILGSLIGSARSAYQLARNDEAYLARAISLLSHGRDVAAMRLARSIKNAATRLDIRILISLVRADENEFLNLTEQVNENSAFALYGSEIKLVRYYVIQHLLYSINTGPKVDVQAIETFWIKHKDVVLTLSHWLNFFLWVDDALLSSNVDPEDFESVDVINHFSTIGSQMAEFILDESEAKVDSLFEEAKRKFGSDAEAFVMLSLLSLMFGDGSEIQPDIASRVLRCACLRFLKKHKEHEVNVFHCIVLYEVVHMFKMRITSIGAMNATEFTDFMQAIEGTLISKNIELPSEQRAFISRLNRDSASNIKID